MKPRRFENRNKTIVAIIDTDRQTVYCFTIAKILFRGRVSKLKGTARLRRFHCSDIWQSPSVLFLSPSVSLIVNDLCICVSFVSLSHEGQTKVDLRSIQIYFHFFFNDIYSNDIYDIRGLNLLSAYSDIFEKFVKFFARVSRVSSTPRYTKTIPEIYRKNVKNQHATSVAMCHFSFIRKNAQEKEVCLQTA